MVKAKRWSVQVSLLVALGLQLPQLIVALVSVFTGGQKFDFFSQWFAVPVLLLAASCLSLWLALRGTKREQANHVRSRMLASVFMIAGWLYPPVFAPIFKTTMDAAFWFGDVFAVLHTVALVPILYSLALTLPRGDKPSLVEEPAKN